MIEIKNTKIYGLEESMLRSAYPHSVGEPQELDSVLLFADKNNRDRSKKLGHAKQGSGHDCFLKGITVTFDLKYSLYFTKQLQRYHFIDFISSQSTMHSITKMQIKNSCNKYVDKNIISILEYWVKWYNKFDDEIKRLKELSRNEGVNTVPDEPKVNTIRLADNAGNVKSLTKYDIFMRIISNTPAGFEYWAGMTTNYLQLKSIYNQRRNHKLKEDWGYFCNWIKNLPSFRGLILDD